jgi:integrase
MPGTDPVSGRRHYLKEVVPAGSDAERWADAVRVRFLAEVNERCNPRTSATVDQLLNRYLDVHTGGRSTVSGYRGYVDKHVRPPLPTGKELAKTTGVATGTAQRAVTLLRS